MKIDSSTSSHHHFDYDKNFSDAFLSALATPHVQVVPEHDWSKIKALWIPRFHHDYQNSYEHNETILLLNKNVDYFGSVQCLLTMKDPDYTPYLTTLFNPTWTPEYVRTIILQALHQPIHTVKTIIPDNSYVFKKIVGKSNNKQLITIYLDENNQIVDAFPIFTPYESV